MRVVTIDMLDNADPPILVQRFIFDDRALLVFRKPTGQAEEEDDWHTPPDVAVDRHLYWVMDRTLSDEWDDPEDPVTQIALVYRDEDQQPTDDPKQRHDASPYASIVYNREDGLYHAEPCFGQGYDALEAIAQPSLKATLYLAAEALYELLAQNGD